MPLELASEIWGGGQKDGPGHRLKVEKPGFHYLEPRAHFNLLLARRVAARARSLDHQPQRDLGTW